MASRKAAKPANKALSRGSVPSRRKQASPSLLQSPLLRTAIVVVGVAGIAAVAIGLFGPRRFNDEILKPFSEATLVPLAAAAAPQADRVWAETRPWRDHVSRLLSSINTHEVRDALADRLSHWLDRLR